MGTAENAFFMHQAEIEAIPENQLIGKNRPVEKITSEVSQLYVVAKEDREEFEAIGRFDISLIDTLHTRRDAYLHCYSMYQEVIFDSAAALEAFRALEEQAYKDKKKLLSRLKMIAMENGDKNELKELRQIAYGNGREDLTLDFLKLSGKVKKQKPELLDMGYVEEELDRVELTFIKLKDLIGSINLPNAERESRQLLMDQAYTFLAMAESKIKDYGQMLFEGTDREDLYKSESRQKIGSQSHANSNEENDLEEESLLV